MLWSLKASGVILGLGCPTWLPLPIPLFMSLQAPLCPICSGDWVSAFLHGNRSNCSGSLPWCSGVENRVVCFDQCGLLFAVVMWGRGRRQRWRETKRESERDTERATARQRKSSTSFKEMKTYGLLLQGLGEPHQEMYNWVFLYLPSAIIVVHELNRNEHF